MNSVMSSNLQIGFDWESDWNRNMNPTINLIMGKGEVLMRMRVKTEEKKKKRPYSSLNSVFLFFYIWMKSIRMTTFQKKKIEMIDDKEVNTSMGAIVDTTTRAAYALPKEMMEEEFLIRLPLKALMRFKCISKDWNEFISNVSFCRRYRSRQQQSKITGFICGTNDNYLQNIHGFCAANMFLYTKNYDVNKEGQVPEESSFAHLNTFGYVIAASKSLLLMVDHNLENLYVYDLVSKKHVKLPRNNNSLEEAGRPNVAALGFKCEENSINDHIWYKVVCVDNPGEDYRELSSNYNVDIYSSETGTWERSIMNSRFPFHVRAHQIAKVIRGVFHWHDISSDSIIAYDSDDPKGRVVFIELPKFDRIAYRRKIRQFEGRKDGSLQFISMDDDNILKVWIMRNKINGPISYMDEEDRISASRWVLSCSVSFFDIGVGFSGLSGNLQALSNIICADPNDPDIIYLFVTKLLKTRCNIVNQLYAYNYRQGKIAFKFSQTIKVEIDVFVHFEWPTWPYL